jgi:SAM-dependent methyltransferase
MRCCSSATSPSRVAASAATQRPGATEPGPRLSAPSTRPNRGSARKRSTVRPDLEYLRREARRLLDRLRAHEADAVGRVQTQAPGMPVALSTAQLVLAREHGFSSWAQLKVLVSSMSSDGVRYDRIGRGYSAYREADRRILAAVVAALANARTVVNVGAGTGSNEPRDRAVIPVEPSSAMALQRDPALPPAVLGVAESLPLADGSADAAMAVLTMHHWTDISRGLSEMRRVARRRVVLLTIDVEVEASMWLFRDYVPEIADRDRTEFPTCGRGLRRGGDRRRRETVARAATGPDDASVAGSIALRDVAPSKGFSAAARSSGWLCVGSVRPIQAAIHGERSRLLHLCTQDDWRPRTAGLQVRVSCAMIAASGETMLDGRVWNVTRSQRERRGRG